MSAGGTAWAGTARSAWAAPAALSLGIAAVVLAVSVHLLVGLVLMVAAVAAVPFTSVRVEIDERGVRVRYGALGWPVSSVALDRIEVASCIHLRPMQWGGWGYRGSRKLLGTAAVVLRAGEAIQLELVDGKKFAVTVDDAEAGAAALRDLGVPTAPEQ